MVLSFNVPFRTIFALVGKSCFVHSFPGQDNRKSQIVNRKSNNPCPYDGCLASTTALFSKMFSSVQL
jgi:hypothetical protein